MYSLALTIIDFTTPGHISAHDRRDLTSRLPFSDTAKDFIDKLLRVDPKERMSIDDCFEHKWMQNIDLYPPRNNFATDTARTDRLKAVLSKPLLFRFVCWILIMNTPDGGCDGRFEAEQELYVRTA